MGKEDGRNMKKILYHYCSVDAFFNIITNSSLWFSDVQKSNDYQECIVCREIVNKSIEEYVEDDVQALKAWKTWYKNGVEANSALRAFCACLTEGQDQLSQWTEYANDGKGMAIGFDKEILEELNLISEHHLAFGQVIYNNTQEYAEEIIEDNIEKLQYKGVGHVALELSQDYKMKFPFVKNRCFQDEKEWRIVICSQIGKYNFPGSDKIKFSKIKYRTTNDKLIPHIEMDFGKVKQSFIKEIWIGPKSEVEVEDVVNFLNFSGYYDNAEDGYNAQRPVNIRKSAATYR